MFSSALRGMAAPVLFLVLAAGAAAAQDADRLRYLRSPHVANDGTLAFSYHGDIWLARPDGSDPRRLTSHVARDIDPRFSPDGRYIAFSSNRMGSTDVYVVPVTGGEPRRLTYYGGNDRVVYWTPDGSGIVVATSRNPHPFLSPLYIVPAEGGLPRPMGMDQAATGMIRQDGAVLAYNPVGFNYARRGYRGSRTAKIWTQDLNTGEFRQLTQTDPHAFREQGHDADPMWGADGRIYFASERSGSFELWRIDPGGGRPEQVTRHGGRGLEQPTISPDGGTIVYILDHELWTYRVGGGEPRQVPIRVAVDPRDNLMDFVTTQNRAESYAPSPDGEQVAVEYRGEIFIVPVDPDLGEVVQVTRSAWRERLPVYSPDGRLLAYVSDESGNEEVWVYDVATAERRRLTDHASIKSDVTWAPDGSRIAFVAANSLFEVSLSNGRVTELAHNYAGGYSLHQYSPDGGWLVYTRRDRDLDANVHLFEIASRTEHDVTRNPFNHGSARLTPDGRTLVFTSNRDDRTNHLFSVSLPRLTEDPDDPRVRARRAEAERGRERGRGTEEAGPIRLDTAGIGRRAVQLTRGDNSAGAFFLSDDGRTIYFTSSDNDGPGLFAVDIDGRNRRRVVAGSFQGIEPTLDGRYAFYRQQASGTGFEVHRVQLSNQRRQRVDFSFTVAVDVRGEWEQLFEESWRVMRDRFYDSDMHGVDWAAVREAYRPLLPHVGTYEDLYDLANHMIGELNASHTGVRGPPSRPMQRGERNRYLGFEVEPGSNGRYRISHIYRDGPADREWLDLRVGDYVLAIDGQEVRAGENYWQILSYTLNDYVPVRVARAADGRDAREVRIRTIGSLNNIRYEEWVARNREFVEQESGGRIAYVHIRSMNQPSLRRFEDEIDRYWNAEGIVIDIRYNGGGNIDQQLIQIMQRQPYQFWNQRWGARTWGRRPRQAIAGPQVLLINSRSGSDSEVTSQAFRDLELGTIVGNPTLGAVIATGSHTLINGGTIRTPGSLVITWDPTQPNNYGINLENFGVPPDIWVYNTPEDELRGYDRELKTAVDEALRMLREGRWQYIADPQANEGGR